MMTIKRTPEQIHQMLDFVLGEMWDNLPDACYCTDENGENDLADDDELYPQIELHNSFCYAPLAKYLAERLADGKADREAAAYVAGFLLPRMDNDDACLCIDKPWLGEMESGNTDWHEMAEDPSNHAQYCPTYLMAYCNAIANDTEVPE